MTTKKMFNMAYDESLVIYTADEYLWTENPGDPLRRVHLESNTAKRADGSSIVHYPAGSSFPGHNHPGGEEILVLEGRFQDENGAYPEGTYIRNPIAYYHNPYSDEGCTIFVKLGRFKESDTERKIIRTQEQGWLQGMVDGLTVMPLHEYEGENVALVKWAPNTQFNPHKHWGGEEIYVIEGTFYDEHGRYPKGSWIRSPHLSQHTPYTKEDGALIFVKTGHLPL